MHIVMATTGFPPAYSWGGPVKIVHQNALELMRRGHRVSVIASNRLDKKQRIAAGSFDRDVDGIDVHYLEMHLIPQWPGTLGPSLLSRDAGRRAREVVAGADVVHVNATRNAIAVQSMRYAQQLGRPLVLQPHGTLPHIVSSKRLKKLYDRLVLKRLLAGVDVFIAGQEAECRQIITAAGPAARVEVVPNGLATGVREKVERQRGVFRRRYSIPEARRILLFLGRINRKKGTDLLVRAFAQMPRAERAQLQLVIAGPDDGQLPEVQALVREHGLSDQVLFTGLLDEAMVWAAHADADLFVLPCRVDTFPMAIVEACQAGTPMVVTETCEIADLLDDKAATIVPVDVGAIAQAMRTLLQDEVLRARYGRGARELMQTVFSMEAVGSALERIYRQVSR